MAAAGHLSHRIFTTKWVGLFAYEPLIKGWTEDLVQINIQQTRVALHSPTRQKHNWWPKQHGSITSHSRRTFATFLLLVSSKSPSIAEPLLIQFRNMSLQKKNSPFLVQQIRGDNLASCTLNDGFVSMQPWVRILNVLPACISKTALSVFRENTALPHVELLITCNHIQNWWTGMWTIC